MLTWTCGVDFIAVNAYTIGMFAPLSFLGTIYNSVIRSLVDVKHLLNLLTEEPDVIDVDNAQDIPIYNSGKSAKKESGRMLENAYSSFPCVQCSQTVQQGWLCCPFCRADISRPTAGAFANLPKLSMIGDSNKAVTQSVSRGVSVEFESKNI